MKTNKQDVKTYSLTMKQLKKLTNDFNLIPDHWKVRNKFNHKKFIEEWIKRNPQ